jgi:hypothetical protein
MTFVLRLEIGSLCANAASEGARSAAPRPALLGGQTPALAVMYDTAFGEQRHFKNLIWSGSQCP